MPQQVNCAGAWSQWLSRFGAVGCVAMLTIALSPSLPCLNSTLFCFVLPLFFSSTRLLPLPTFPSHCPTSIISFITLPTSFLLCPPCSMRHQVGSATLGCRAALTASSATACLGFRGAGASLRTSMKPCTIWTGCSKVSPRHPSTEAPDTLARCFMHDAPLFCRVYLCLVFVSHLFYLTDLLFKDLTCSFMCFICFKSLTYYNTSPFFSDYTIRFLVVLSVFFTLYTLCLK